MVAAEEKSAPSEAVPADPRGDAKRSSAQAKPLWTDGPQPRLAVSCAPWLAVMYAGLAKAMNEVTTLPAMLLPLTTYNARVQPQIRAQREFVGWNTLLECTWHYTSILNPKSMSHPA